MVRVKNRSKRSSRRMNRSKRSSRTMNRSKRSSRRMNRSKRSSRRMNRSRNKKMKNSKNIIRGGMQGDQSEALGRHPCWEGAYADIERDQRWTEDFDEILPGWLAGSQHREDDEDLGKIRKCENENCGRILNKVLDLIEEDLERTKFEYSRPGGRGKKYLERLCKVNPQDKKNPEKTLTRLRDFRVGSGLAEAAALAAAAKAADNAADAKAATVLLSGWNKFHLTVLKNAIHYSDGKIQEIFDNRAANLHGHSAPLHWVISKLQGNKPSYAQWAHAEHNLVPRITESWPTLMDILERALSTAVAEEETSVVARAPWKNRLLTASCPAPSSVTGVSRDSVYGGEYQVPPAMHSGRASASCSTVGRYSDQSGYEDPVDVAEALQPSPSINLETSAPGLFKRVGDAFTSFLNPSSELNEPLMDNTGSF